MMTLKKYLKRLLLGKKIENILQEKAINGEDQQVSQPEDRVYNPLYLAINDMVELRSEQAGTYEVCRITEYITRVVNILQRSVRYYLQDKDAPQEAELLALELIQQETNPTDSQQPGSIENQIAERYLFHVIQDFEYNKEFVALLDDDMLLVSEENDEEILEKEYEKTLHLASGYTTIQHDQQLQTGAVSVWKYELDTEPEKLFLHVEIDISHGRTRIYEGRKLQTDAPPVIYRLSKIP